MDTRYELLITIVSVGTVLALLVGGATVALLVGRS
jgi:hypothetical protein